MLWQAFGRWGAIGANTSPSGSFTPESLGSDLQAWWDPELGLTYHSGSSVKWWDDQKNARRFTSASGTAPTGMVTTQNGHYVIDLTTPTGVNMDAPYTITGTQFMLACAIKPTSGGQAYGRWFSHCRTTDGDDYTRDTAWEMSRDNLTNDGGAVRNGSFGTSANMLGVWSVVIIAFDGVDCRFYRDGTLVGTPLAKTANFNATSLGLGKSIDSTPYPDSGTAYYGDIITMHRAPTTTEREKLEGWLAHKWGLTGNLPSGHPYKTTAP